MTTCTSDVAAKLQHYKERSFEGAIYEFNNTLASQAEEAAHHMLTITVAVTNAHDSGEAASTANRNFIFSSKKY